MTFTFKFILYNYFTQISQKSIISLFKQKLIIFNILIFAKFRDLNIHNSKIFACCYFLKLLCCLTNLSSSTKKVINIYLLFLRDYILISKLNHTNPQS